MVVCAECGLDPTARRRVAPWVDNAALPRPFLHQLHPDNVCPKHPDRPGLQGTRWAGIGEGKEKLCRQKESLQVRD